MGYPSIYECLKIVSEIIQQRKDLEDSLIFMKRILQVQLELENALNKGVNVIGRNQSSISSLEQRSLETKTPIIRLLDPTLGYSDLLKSVFGNLAKVLISRYPNKNLHKLLAHIDSGKTDLMYLIRATLKEDEKPIISFAKKFEVAPSLLLFLINSTIQPIIKEISRRVSSPFYDRWWRVLCPICGRTPTVARIRDRKRYLMCNFCGAEYISDYFICVNCENKDPNTLNYLVIDGKPEFQIDFCMKCNHYLKVIIESELKEPIPRCVEDILTLDLDIAAKHSCISGTT